MACLCFARRARDDVGTGTAPHKRGTPQNAERTADAIPLYRPLEVSQTRGACELPTWARSRSMVPKSLYEASETHRWYGSARTQEGGGGGRGGGARD